VWTNSIVIVIYVHTKKFVNFNYNGKVMTGILNLIKKISLVVVMVFLIINPTSSFAAETGVVPYNSENDTEITRVLCKVVKLLTGKAGRAIASTAVVVLGIGLFLGKLSWGIAVATAVGIGLIFGAERVVFWLSPTADASMFCTTDTRTSGYFFR
jgi:type IV secretion system protein VirB2